METFAEMIFKRITVILFLVLVIARLFGIGN